MTPTQTPAQKALTEAGFTQADIARRLENGEALVSKWFQGKVRPGRHNRKLLVRALGREFVDTHFPEGRS